MPDPALDELNSSTVKDLQNDIVADGIFKACPFGAYLREYALHPWNGGAFDQFDFTYAAMNWAWYARGAGAFNLAKPQTLTGATFDPKTMEVNITELMEDLYITNFGPNARISLIDTDSETAVNTMNAAFEISCFHHGQNISGDNRQLAINGLEEVLNNGYDPSWFGHVFTTYGNQSRTGVLKPSSAISSMSYWAGTPAGGTGMITYDFLLQKYLACLRTGDPRGAGYPNLIISNLPAFGFMLSRIQAAQQFRQERDPVWGVETFKLMNAHVLPCNYAPSLIAGVNDPVLGNYLTSTVSTSGLSLTTQGGWPSSTTCTIGEVIFILNTGTFRLRPVAQGPFSGEFKPFIMAAENTKISGQFLLGVILECLSPWNDCAISGIGS
jgi:hypothetical protein